MYETLIHILYGEDAISAKDIADAFKSRYIRPVASCSNCKFCTWSAYGSPRCIFPTKGVDPVNGFAVTETLVCDEHTPRDGSLCTSDPEAFTYREVGEVAGVKLFARGNHQDAINVERILVNAVKVAYGFGNDDGR